MPSNSNGITKKVPEWSIEMRTRIVELHITRRNSLQRVSDATGVPKSTVHDICKKYKETGSLENKTRTGRPSMTKDCLDIVEKIKAENEDLSSRKIAEMIKEKYKITISHKSICMILAQRRNITRTVDNGQGEQVERKKDKK